MSDYNIRPGGSLKFKGGNADGGIVKKKKKRSKVKEDVEQAHKKEQLKERLLAQDLSEEPSGSGSGRNSPALGQSSSSSARKTEAERRFEEVQRKRMEQKVAKLAGMTHKDRVSEFNAHLESLSEHHDIPKVGPG